MDSLDKNLEPADLLDIARRMEEYVAITRKRDEQSSILIRYLGDYIARVFSQPIEDAHLIKLTAEFVDMIYLQICRMPLRDRYVDAYFEVFVRSVMLGIAKGNVFGLYVLDNTLRDDRFKLLIELYKLAGFVCIHPYAVQQLEYTNEVTKHPTRDYKDVESLFAEAVASKRHIFYVEKDDSINYLKQILELAEEVQPRHVCIFRNSGPDAGEPPRVLFGNIVAAIRD